MDIIHCPNCDEPLSGTPDYCPKCGEYLSLPELKTPESSINEDPTIPIALDPEDPTAPEVPSTAISRYRVLPPALPSVEQLHCMAPTSPHMGKLV